MVTAAAWQLERFRNRIAMARKRLGDKCVRYGSENNLEFDHIDPETKLANVSDIANWRLDRFLAEVDKCQLLCRKCHIRKTTADCPTACPVSGIGRARCPCEECREMRRIHHREYMQQWRAEKRRQAALASAGG